MKMVLAVLMALLLVSGCEKKKPAIGGSSDEATRQSVEKESVIDGSSDEAMQQSVEEVFKSLPKAEADVFKSSYMQILFAKTLGGVDKAEIMKMLDGKSASEVVELAKNLH